MKIKSGGPANQGYRTPETDSEWAEEPMAMHQDGAG